ncbi:MAG: glycosyltransferase family 4 protein [Sphingomonadaceae bacterium]
MKLIYLANNRIPSEKANSLQIMQMCQAFREQGVEVELVVPRRAQPRTMRSVKDPFAYYGLKSRFPIVWLPCVDALEVAPAPAQHAAFALQSTTYALAVAAYLATHKADMYYSRDPLSTVLLALSPASIRERSVYEAHTFPGPGRRRELHLWAVRRIAHLVCITRGLAEEYRIQGVPGERILVAPDAVDLDRFRSMPEKSEARRQLGIPEEARVACYTGHLYPWKGAHTLAMASRLMPEGYLVYLVGGTEEDCRGFRRFLADHGLGRVRLVGHVTPDRVIGYLAAADVLVLPNSATDVRSSRYTSPMKLFEYMAARRPIVASRLPSLQEVLRDGENALLVEPDDPQALAEGIATMSCDAALARQLAARAWLEAQGRSWAGRAKAILCLTGDTRETAQLI